MSAFAFCVAFKQHLEGGDDFVFGIACVGHCVELSRYRSCSDMCLHINISSVDDLFCMSSSCLERRKWLVKSMISQQLHAGFASEPVEVMVRGDKAGRIEFDSALAKATLLHFLVGATLTRAAGCLSSVEQIVCLHDTRYHLRSIPRCPSHRLQPVRSPLYIYAHRTSGASGTVATAARVSHSCSCSPPPKNPRL